MKIWVVVLVALGMGLLVGCGITWYEFAGVQELFNTVDSSDGKSGGGKPGPKAKVEGGQEHDFGAMQVGATKSHEFIVRNLGTAPLTLTEGEGKPSCQCTRFEVPREPIPPGESGKVFLEWKPKEFNPDFSQTAEVRTNDAAHATIRLTIRGTVTQFARPFPAEFALGSISTNEEQTAQIRIFGYSDGELKIDKSEFVEPGSAAFFDVSIEPLPKEEVAAERFAQSGLLLTIKTKSGLPLGQINQTIRLVFADEKAYWLDVPIKGTVTSDISVLGGENFNKAENVLNLRLIKGSQGSKTVLRLLVKGPHRHEAALKLADVDPADVLRATLGEPTEINSGKVVVYLLTIEIPAGSRPINRIQSPQSKPGNIHIQTNLPDVKELIVHVSFAIED